MKRRTALVSGMTGIRALPKQIQALEPICPRKGHPALCRAGRNELE